MTTCKEMLTRSTAAADTRLTSALTDKLLINLKLAFPGHGLFRQTIFQDTVQLTVWQAAGLGRIGTEDTKVEEAEAQHQGWCLCSSALVECWTCQH